MKEQILRALELHTKWLGNNKKGKRFRIKDYGLDFLKGEYLGGVNFRKADFQDADLENTDFYEAQLQNANFSRANLNGAKFIKAKANWANFTSASMDEADFGWADLECANFLYSKMVYANFSNVKLINTIGIMSNQIYSFAGFSDIYRLYNYLINEDIMYFTNNACSLDQFYEMTLKNKVYGEDSELIEMINLIRKLKIRRGIK